MARYIHDPYNPSLPPKRVLTTRERIEEVAEVIEAQHPYYLCEFYGRLAFRGVMLFQSTHLWHWFDMEGFTGSGRTPKAAYSGGLIGDVIDSNRRLRTYCELVFKAPERYAQMVAVIRFAQRSCYNEKM